MAAMPSRSFAVDYKSDLRLDKDASPDASAVFRGESAARLNVAAETPVVRPIDFAAVEEFLQQLAKAVRQFRTYPATSPLCADAISQAHKALASLERDRLAFRLTPRELIVDEIGVGSGTIVEHELVRRLHKAHIAAVDVERHASQRDLSRFCTNVSRSEDFSKTKTTLAELLAEHGVDTIVPHLAHRPEVLEVGVPRAPLCSLVEHERSRRQAAVASGPVSYLYPPDKGWVRLDPSAAFETISLVDLAILVDDPGDVATMLLRLTDDEAAGGDQRERALQQKYGDLATLFGALDPNLARVMFSKLARAVLELEPQRRKDLLKRTVLPSLLDGRPDGAILRDFSNDDLAESLCLLMDLETAAPELLTTALDRLDLPAERRQIMEPLLEERLRGGKRASEANGATEPGVDRHARRLIRVEPGAGKNFAEFASFDLAIDDQTTATLGHIREGIGQTDLPIAQLGFLLGLIRLEPNPAVADMFLRRSVSVFGELEHRTRLDDLVEWVAQYRHLADSLEASRPDVSEAVSNMLTALCTPERFVALSDPREDGADARALAKRVIEAFGRTAAPTLVTLLDDPGMQARARALVPLMCEQGGQLAPALAARLNGCGVSARRAIVKVLGHAGPGHEQVLAEQLEHVDEQTGRDALQALAHIGTAKAAQIVGMQLQEGAGAVRAAAEEALRHFAPAQAEATMRDLLARREFVLRHPQIALRLIDRVGHAGVTGLEPAMRDLAGLRYRFWNPKIVRVAMKARTLLEPRTPSKS
jgi:hypothetical protein